MTFSEENYIKAIYHLSGTLGAEVTTNAIAEKMETKASSVTDMLKKLAYKKLIAYKKYQGVSLTELGQNAARMIVRKHRLWEVFLVDKLDFSWDEVHEVAEQLEHIKSEQLVTRLDKFLGFPTEDPHGDPIPNSKGQVRTIKKQLLSELEASQSGICVGVKDTSSEFLKYLGKNGIALGSKIEIIAKEAFDFSMTITVNGKELAVSDKIAGNLFVKVD